MWLKKLRHRKFQSSMIFMIALICSLLLTSAISIILSLEKPFWELVEACQSPAVMLFLRDSTQQSVERMQTVVEESEGVQEIKLLDQYQFNQAKTMSGEKIEGFFWLSEYREDVHQNLRYVSEKPHGLLPNECLVPEVIRQSYDLEVGDEIRLTIGNTDYVYRINAFVVEPYMSSLASACEIIVKTLPQGGTYGKVMLVYGDNNQTGAELITHIRANNGGQLNAVTRPLEEMVQFNLITGQILGGVLFGGGLIILLVSCMIIRFMVRNTVLAEIKTIATYKTIGYTNNMILGMYMKAYLFLTCLGVGLGIVGSYGISYSFLEQAFETIGVKRGGTLLIPGIITIVVVVGIVALNIYSVLRTTRKVSPVEIFLDRKSELGKRKTTPKKRNRLICFSPVHMAMRVLRRERRNTIFIILTAVVSLYGVNFAVATMDTVKSFAEYNYYWLGFDASDVFLETNAPECADVVYNQVTKDPRVTKVVRENADRGVELKWQKGMADTNIQAYVFEDLSAIDVPLIEGRNPKYADEVALTTVITEQLGKSIGDYIEIVIGEKTQSFLITGTFQSYYGMGRCVRMLGEAFEGSGMPFYYPSLSVYLKEGVDREVFKEEYETLYGSSLQVTNREDVFKAILDMITAPQEKALMPFMSFIIVMGLINIFGIVVLRNVTHAKINSIYKSIGFESMHLIRVNMWYITIIAGVASLVTLPLFIVSYPHVMSLALSVFGFEKYPVLYDLGHLVVMNGLVVMLFMMSSLLSSVSLYKLSVKTLNQE
ncbi:MAG: FtsX-like permease family protein [Cellulosilyticaceae bacterium]